MSEPDAAQAIPPLPQVAGLSLDGSAPVAISAAENRALCRTMGVDPDPAGRAHPSYFYTATQVGMGLSVAELCAACAFDVRDGPLMATTSARFHGPMMTETAYRVRGSVVGLSRKHSRRLGIIDLLEYRLRLETPGGDCIVETGNLWVLPRTAKRK